MIPVDSPCPRFVLENLPVKLLNLPSRSSHVPRRLPTARLMINRTGYSPALWLQVP